MNTICWLKNEGTLNKTPEKQTQEKVVKTVPITLSESVSEYDDVF